VHIPVKKRKGLGSFYQAVLTGLLCANCFFCGCASVEERIRDKIEFVLPVQEAQPGEIFKFTCVVPRSIKSGKVIFLNKTFPLYFHQDSKKPVYFAFLAVPWKTDPGDYDLTCVFQADGPLREITETVPFQVLPAVQSAEQEKVRRSTFDATLWEQDCRKLAESVGSGTYAPKRLQNFLLPLKGRVQAGFGQERVFNHGAPLVLEGMEIEPLAHGNTWDITSTAEGRVAEVLSLPMFGKVVIVDHGFGFFSLYSHMQSVQVTVGQMVARGEKLGRVGKTGGAALGNRLYFQLFVNGIPVNVKKAIGMTTFK
jgi:murein DD-endopeptidase MepM/ murein hydrolase activator NlpD